MPCVNRSDGNNPTFLLDFILGLLILSPIYVTAQDSPPPDPDANYSPPMTTVLIVMIGLFFTVGFLSLFLRHFAWCLGYEYAGGGGGGDRGNGGSIWRRSAPRGLDSAVVESFPTFLYSDVKVHRIGKGTLECAVCLNEFEDDEVLRLLPGCSHVFHPDCIAPWLASHVTCPVCRTNLDFHNNGVPHPHDTLSPHHPSDDRTTNVISSEPSEQTVTHDNDRRDHDVIVRISPSPDVIIITSPVVAQGRKDGGVRMGKLTRSHSTGHSLVGDCERFTLRLPEDVLNKLVNPVFGPLPAMISPPVGYRARSVGCTGTTSVKPERWRFSASPPFISRSNHTSAWPSPKYEGANNVSNNNVSSSGLMSGSRSLFKSIKSPLNRMVRSSDIGERSSDRLWPNRPSHGLEPEGQ